MIALFICVLLCLFLELGILLPQLGDYRFELPNSQGSCDIRRWDLCCGLGSCSHPQPMCCPSLGARELELLDQVHCLWFFHWKGNCIHYLLGCSIIFRLLFHLSPQKFSKMLLLYFKYISISVKLEMHPVIIHIHTSVVACLSMFYPKQSCLVDYPLVVMLCRPMV